MRFHVLKIDERWFNRLSDGSKTAEVRKHDRDYQIGDRLIFVRQDWGPQYPSTVRVIEGTVSHILPASVFPEALQPGYSVLSLVDVGCERDHDPAAVLEPAATTTNPGAGA
jgi:hypothetical protein